MDATSVTGNPASCSARAEPPVETSATPRAASARANGASPSLSLTEISARRIGMTDSRGAASVIAGLLLSRLPGDIGRSIRSGKGQPGKSGLPEQFASRDDQLRMVPLSAQAHARLAAA